MFCLGICLHLQICCLKVQNMSLFCGITRALTNRFASWTEFNIICPTGGRRRDSVTEWQDSILEVKEKYKKFKEPKKVQPAFLMGYKEEDSWKLFRSSFKGWKMCRAERKCLNLAPKERTCDRKAHIDGHVYGGPVVRISRYTVHCFKCWARLPGGAAGFRGAYWQR